MIMLKTLSEDVTPVGMTVSDKLNLSMEAAATLLSEKHLSTELKFVTDPKSHNAVCNSSSKPFCKDDLLDNLNISKCDTNILTAMSSHSNTSSSSVFKMAKPNMSVAAASFQTNLFQAGFQDCASEVIRFLVEQERLDGSNPLIQGLQSHLHKMSNTICGENIADLDYSCPQNIVSDISASSNSLCKTTETKCKYTSSDISFNNSQNTPSLVLDALSLQNVVHSSTPESTLKRKRDSEGYSHEDQVHNNVKKMYQNKNRLLHPSKSDFECVEESKESEVISSHSFSYNKNVTSEKLSSSLPTSSASTTITSSMLDSEVIPVTSEDQPTPHVNSSSSSPPDNQSSVLELRAHFLPGIDTSSIATGDFADTLLAVESCQSHENPRVRELAERIINLIHNNDEDDDDEDEDDENEEDQCVNDDRNVNRTGSTNHNDSGIDLGNDGTDWCNPVDMIEL